MMEFGKSLKQAREAKGLSVAQLVEETHLAPTTISELENEDFSHIAAPIYGRGFVKLYCEAVGLDSKPFVNEFMEIFSGNHDSAIRERPVAAAEPEAEERPVATAEPEAEETPAEPEVAECPVVAAPEPEAPPPDLFNCGSTVSSVPPIANPFGERDSLFVANPIPSSEPPAQTQALPPESDEHAYSRYAAPIRQRKSIPPSVWRLGVLTLGALVILTLLVLGIRTLYRATSPEPTEPADKQEPVATTAPAPKASAVKSTAENKAKAANDTKAKRNPQPIPSLYVD